MPKLERMSIREQVLKRIRSKEAGWVFTPSDFLELGSHYAIGMALGRLIRAGHIERIARGLYHRPGQHPKFGRMPPTPAAIVAAIARRDGATFRETGASAANKLQLSEQVPMRLAYETDGQSRRIEAGGMKIDLIHRRPNQIRRSTPVSQLVFSALRERRSVKGGRDEWERLGALLSEADKRKLLKDLPLAPAWMHQAIRAIAAERGREARTNLLEVGDPKKGRPR